MASTNVEVMVEFYQSVFGVRFTKLPANGRYIYTAQLFGTKVVIMQSEVVGTTAERNRYELNVIVPDLEAALGRAATTGATQVGGVKRGPSERSARIADPDGNTMVLVQKD